MRRNRFSPSLMNLEGRSLAVGVIAMDPMFTPDGLPPDPGPAEVVADPESLFTPDGPAVMVPYGVVLGGDQFQSADAFAVLFPQDYLVTVVSAGPYVQTPMSPVVFAPMGS